MFGLGKKSTQLENTQAQITAPIFTMPEEYRHGASPMRAPAEPVRTLVKAPPPPAAPTPVARLQASKPSVHHTLRNGLLIGGIFLIVALAVGGYFLLRTDSSPQPQRIVKQQQPLPAVPRSGENEGPNEEPSEGPNEEPASETPTEPFPTATAPGRDTDSDGLTDVEENVIYRTNPRLPDTDQDGFLDGNEVFHGYHPDGTAPDTLFTSNLLQKFDAPSFSLYYPSGWTLQQRSGADDLLMVATTGESVSAATVEKLPAQTLLDWHAAQPSGAPVSALTTKKGGSALLTQDGMTAYLDAGDKVVVLSLHTGVKGTVEYLQTFKMMLNSLVITE